MAKSARASSRKKNNANLRAKVFGPAHDARTERLSAKLQELAAAPKPEQDKAMSDESQNAGDSSTSTTTLLSDVQMKETQSKPSILKKSKKSGRIQKSNSRRKAKSSMVFASELARQKRQADNKKKRK